MLEGSVLLVRWGGGCVVGSVIHAPVFIIIWRMQKAIQMQKCSKTSIDD